MGESCAASITAASTEAEAAQSQGTCLDIAGIVGERGTLHNGRVLP
jgi:hypothetical protein